MSLNSYLEKLSSNLVLSFEENERIKTSLKILKGMIEQYLTGILEHFCFGSYPRGTKLTHRVDSTSDVDYLIVFNKEKEVDPEELVGRLREFVEHHFTQGQIIRTSPTCIVEIQSIRFELIPAYKEGNYLVNYKIPTEQVEETIEWIRTIPNEFNNYLMKFNSEHNYYIIPLIRIFKYWNIINGNVFSSYELEHELMFKDYPQFESLRDYFFYSVEELKNLDATGLDEKWFIFQEKIERIKNEPSEERALHQLSLLLPFL